MEIEFLNIIIYIAIFIFAFLLSLLFLERISRVIFEAYASRFDTQIELYKKYTDEALNTHLRNLDKAQFFKKQILQNFESIDEEMNIFRQQLKHLNELCENREKLESEILKLKNILKRKEKNHE